MKKIVFFITLLCFVVSCKKEEVKHEDKCNNLYLNEVLFDIQANHSGVFDDIKDENGKIDNNKFYLFRVEDGKRVKIHAQYDPDCMYSIGSSGEKISHLCISITDKGELERIHSLGKETFYIQDLCRVRIIQLKSRQVEEQCMRRLTKFWIDGKDEFFNEEPDGGKVVLDILR